MKKPISKEELKEIVQDSIKEVQRQQVKEALKIGAYCVYSSKELKELGFTPKEIKQIKERRK